MAKIGESGLACGAARLLSGGLTTQDMIKAAQKLSDLPLYAVEVLCPGDFDFVYKSLAEDPWKRIESVVNALGDRPAMATVAGQSLVGNIPQGDDVVDAFTARLAKAGIRLVRVFDPLNDVSNITRTLSSARKAGMSVEGMIVCVAEPTINIETLVEYGRKLKELGAASICLADVTGGLSAKRMGELVDALKGIGVDIHVSATTANAMATASYLAALDAGAAGVECCFSAFAGGAAYPATESLVELLGEGDADAFAAAGTEIAVIAEKYAGAFRRAMERPDSRALRARLTPALFNKLLALLVDKGATGKLNDVVKELQVLRKELGEPPLLGYPGWLIVEHAVKNALGRGRNEQVSDDMRALAAGRYGALPDAADQKVLATLRGKKDMGEAPANTLHALSEKYPKLADKPDALLGIALCPETAQAYYDGSAKASGWPQLAPRAYDIAVDGESYRVEVAPAGEGLRIMPAEMKAKPKAAAPARPAPSRPAPAGSSSRPAPSRPAPAAIKPSAAASQPTPSPKAAPKKEAASTPPDNANGQGKVASPMQGSVVKLLVKPGDKISRGDVVAVLEAMKMENDIPSPIGGTVKNILVNAGDAVQSGQALLELGD